MKNTVWAVCAFLMYAAGSIAAHANGPVERWVTTKDGSVLFENKTQEVIPEVTQKRVPVIYVDPDIRFQEMDGFGFSLTGGSALAIHRMSADKRKTLLEHLFGAGPTDIGISYLRVSIGASDLDERPFSYVDLPAGEEDKDLENFSIDEDRKHLIPVLLEILAIDPTIKIMGSPWSAPTWMKSNGDTRGGHLKPEFYASYAQYFVKYLRAMEAEGIILDSITVQNEPLHPGNNPSMYMAAGDQATFVRDHLGPIFQSEGLKTKIIIFDHNLDHIEYPMSILKDKEAAQYIDGSAFHHYRGTIGEMARVHDAFPDKNLYFTEQWVGNRKGQNTLNDILEWHMKNLLIGAPRNWAKNVLEWNLASDENLDPHTDRGGCHLCIGAVTIEGDKVRKRPAYYFIAHASKFVRPGSVRINSNIPDGLSNVAYETPDGSIVLNVLNDTKKPTHFFIQIGARKVLQYIPAGSTGTYILR
ncbi:MAG: hypothetical protein KUG56_08390 [Kordiimonadaceae bacterium]|nr:hypothetical protein [Kordiimonadaceae bacterium]